MPDARWLGLAEAAAYLSVRPDTISAFVRQGRLPRPSYALGSRMPRWDRHELDAVFQGGAASTDADRAAHAAAEAEAGH
jgi:predicted DNA-binding transcriptional regulator AlpA